MEMLIVGMKKADGETALEALDDARSDKSVKLDDLALVYRNDKGKVKIRQTSDATIGKGVGRGGVLGLLVGLVVAAGPAGWGVAALATLAGGAIGGVITAFDDGIDNPMMRKLGANLDMHESVLIALGDKPEIAKLEDGFAPYSDELTYEVVPDATQDLIKEMAKLSIDDIGQAGAD